MIVFCFLSLLFSSKQQVFAQEDCSGRRNCSGAGDCVAKDVCSCYDGYYEDQIVGCAMKVSKTTVFKTTTVMVPTPPPIVASVVTNMFQTAPSGLSSSHAIDTTIILLIIGGVIVFLVIALVAVLCVICALRPNSSLAVSYRERKANFSSRYRAHEKDDDNNEFALGPRIDDDRPPRDSFMNISGAAMATALYDFRGMQPGDLSFKAGDQIKLLQHSNNWWQGMLNGQVGVFPRNYVALTRESTWQAPAPTIGSRMPRASYSPFSKTKQAIALYDFNGTDDDDLSFKKGDLITVTKGADTWWEGRLKNGKTGNFPRNYVKLQQ